MPMVIIDKYHNNAIFHVPFIIHLYSVLDNNVSTDSVVGHYFFAY